MTALRSGRRIRSAAALAASAAVVFGLAACSSSASPEASGGEDCTTDIVLLTNVTGAGTSNGSSNVVGVQAAVDAVNEDGGVLGCDLAFDVLDDTSDYTKSLPLLQGAMSEKDYSLVISGDFSGASVAPYVTREGALGIFSNGTLGLTDDNPTVFDVSVPTAFTAPALLEYMASQDIESVALLVDSTSVGEAAQAAYTAAAEENGVEVLTTERVDLSSIDMTPAIQRLQASGADALLVNVFGAAAGYVIRDFTASGWDVPLFGGTSVFSSSLTEIVPPEDLEGVVVVGPAVGTTPSSEATEEFIARIEDAGEEINVPLPLFAQVHDAVILFAWAANETGSLDPQTIADFLQENGDTPVPGLTLAESTNYGPDQRFWNPTNGVAVAQAGERDQGRLERIEFVGNTD